MTNVLLGGVLLVSIVALIVAVGTLRSSRRAEGLGEDRYELLREQQERLQALREERQVLVEKLERESRERQHLMEILQGESPRLAENLERVLEGETGIAQRAEEQEQQRLRLEQAIRDLQDELERERQEHQEVRRRAEELAREREERLTVNQEMEQLEQERQRLTEVLEEERRGHAEAQDRADQSDQERALLAEDLQRLQAELEELEEQKRAPHPEEAGGGSEATTLWVVWKRRRVLIAGLLVGTLVAWFVSLIVALSLLTS